LKFERVALGSVEERRDGIAHFLFDIALLKVFFHLGSHPFEVHDAALARIAVVRSV